MCAQTQQQSQNTVSMSQEYPGQISALRAQRDDALARLTAAETERDELKAIVVRGNVWETAEQNRILGAEARVEAAEQALDLVDSSYPLSVFPERTDEQRDAIFAAMREVDPFATEWFYAHVARERGRVARAALACPPQQPEKAGE